jgi:hypothetical protein
VAGHVGSCFAEKDRGVDPERGRPARPGRLGAVYPRRNFRGHTLLRCEDLPLPYPARAGRPRSDRPTAYFDSLLLGNERR